MEALRFGRDEHLVGILHRPGSADNGRAVLLWNTGISNRVGPYRLNFEIAKALAKMGYTVLRFDLSQLGDSVSLGRETDIQTRTSADIRDAVDHLEERFGIHEVILIGLCSSAVDAYYFAKDDKRIRGLVLVDGLVYPTKEHRRRLFWHRLKSPYRWMHALRNRLLKPLPALPRDFFESNYPSPEEASRGIQTMLNEDRRLLVIFTGGFTPFFTYEKQFQDMLPGLNPGPNLELRHWPSFDHLFILEEDRQVFLSALETWLEKNFSALPLLEEVIDNIPPPREEKISEVEVSAPEEKASIPVGPALSADEILSVFREVLHSRIIEAEDSFFDYGGNSILALRTLALLEEKHGFVLPVVALYTYPEASKLAEAIARQEFSEGSAPGQETKKEKEEGFLERDDIAIIGMACHVPGANTLEDFWSIIRDARETIRQFSPEELDVSIPLDIRRHPSYVASRGVIEGDHFDASFFGISRREAMLTDPQQRILLQTCWNALEDAGYIATRQEKTIAVYAGVGSNTYLTRNLMMGHAKPHSEEEYMAFLLNDKDHAATRIAYHMDLKGPAVSVHTACSTSLVAVIEAIKCLQSGQAEIALAGAASVNAPIASGHLYQEGGIFSKDGHCRPFDAAASGTMFSDGAGVLVLKPLKAALRDKDSIHAVIKGWGLNNDGANKSSFAAPSVHGQAEAIRMALGSMDPESISYIECHGTATPIGDPIEVEALKRVYNSKKKQHCALGSVKANIGHLTAAAGAIGLIKAALCLREKVIPAQTHFRELNPNLRLDQTPFYVPREAKAWKEEGLRRAAVSSFGVGGTNSHLILEEAPLREAKEFEEDDPWMVLYWSGKDAASCQRLGARIQESRRDRQDLSYTLEKTRAALPYAQALCLHPELSQKTIKAPVPYPVKTGKRPLILCFTGQGSNYAGMGLHLANVWPRFEQNYNAVLNLFANEHGLDLRSRVKDVAALQETAYAQPALFALQWALAQSLLETGLEVTALLGHSLGEISAAMIAGVFDLRTAAAFVVARARSMQAAEAGQMLAVRATRQEIEEQLIPSVEIAAVNSDRSLIVSGPKPAIDDFKKKLDAQGVPSKALATSHAFHSAMMDGVLESFRSKIKDMNFHRPLRKVISTVTGKVLSPRDCQSVDYWVQQIRKTVCFADAVAQANNLFPNAYFVEIGPKDALTRFVQQILKSDGSAAATLPQRNENSEGDDFAALVADLWCAGHRPFAANGGRTISAPVYPFHGERLWLDPKSEGREMQTMTPRSQAHSEEIRLKQLLSDLIGSDPSTLGGQKSWMEMGMDSLLLTQWALKIQREFAIEMNVQRLQGDTPNMEALLRLIPSRRTNESENENLPRATSSDWTGMSALENLANALPAFENAGQGLPMLDSASHELLRHVMDQQFQLMNRQLDILNRLAARAPQSSEPSFRERLLNLPVEGEHQFQRDQGSVSVPKYKGSFLAQDPNGETSVYIEDPENPGQFWQIIHD